MYSSESALTMEMPELPDENIFDILSRMPVKSLMRFKCVSKAWCSLISDPKFIKAHLCQQGKSSSKILFSTRSHASIMDYEDCENPIVELSYPITVQRWSLAEFAGSCDGLICLMLNRESFVIWNPSTREAGKLSHPVQFHRDRNHQFFGFGYDSSIDDYKVVTGICGRDAKSVHHNKVAVFTIKSNKWKLIKFDAIGHELWTRPGILFNGNLHWFSAFSDPKEVLLSFNLKEEKFMEVVPLPADCYADCCQMSLAASANSLFLLAADFEDSSDLIVWKKSADVVENTWTKLYQVSFGFVPNLDNPTYQLYITRYNKLVLSHFGNSLATYDLETMTHKDFQVTGMSDGIGIGIVYLESLVSPN